jgi:hypothetical protein
VADPTPAEHRAWAKKNQEDFEKFRAKSPDWAVTSLFYVGVHEVQALLVERGDRPETHKERNVLIRRYWRTSIWPPYEALMQASQDARYHCLMPTPSDVNKAVLTLTKLRAAIATLGSGVTTP